MGDGLDATSSEYVGADELLKVPLPVRDRDLASEIDGWFARPERLPGRAVAVQAGAADRHPVPQSMARVAEVAQPGDRCRGVRALVVAAQPVGVESGQFPDQLVVAVPVRRNDRRWEAEA